MISILQWICLNSIDNAECARPQNIETNLFSIDFFNLYKVYIDLRNMNLS